MPMSTAESRPLLASQAITAPRRRRSGRGLRSWLLLGLVGSYFVVVLGAPVGALVARGAAIGGAALLAAATSDAWGALGLSLALAGTAVAVSAVVGTALALALVRHRFPGEGLVSALCDLPLAVSPVMIGLALLLLLGRDGSLAPLLDRMGWRVVFAYPAILLATLFVTLPYTVREVALVLEELGTTDEEAATTLGASGWQTFWWVTFPNIRVALGYGLLMTGARALGEFGAVMVVGGSIAGSTRTATTFVHDAMEERREAAAYGMALVLAVVSVGLLLGLEWSKRRRERALAGGGSS